MNKDSERYHTNVTMNTFPKHATSTFKAVMRSSSRLELSHAPARPARARAPARSSCPDFLQRQRFVSSAAQRICLSTSTLSFPRAQLNQLQAPIKSAQLQLELSASSCKSSAAGERGLIRACCNRAPSGSSTNSASCEAWSRQLVRSRAHDMRAQQQQNGSCACVRMQWLALKANRARAQLLHAYAQLRSLLSIKINST